MSEREQSIAAILGGITGLLIVIVFFIISPMNDNYNECEKITLCH